MELRDRILAGIATLDLADEASVDVAALVHRLVLFEEVVLESVRLKEVPALVRAFGAGGLEALLEAGVLRIACDAVTVGQTGQLQALESRVAKGVLPLGSYSFSVVEYYGRREYLHQCLQEVHKSEELSLKEAIKLKQTIVSRILPPLDAAGVESALIHDIAGNQNLVRRAVGSVLAEEGLALQADDLQVVVHQLDAEDVLVETNLQARFSIDLTEEHRLVEKALLGVGGLNLRLTEMRVRDGVGALKESELPLLEDKLSFLLNDVLPMEQERRFDRVLDVTQLPEPDLSSPRAVDVDGLLELRDSPEAREFRAWLRTSDGLSDDEMRDLLPSLRDRFARVIRGKAGRTARFAVSTGAGLAAGDVSGTGAGAVDSFVLDRLLPRPGPLAWLAWTYPSLFNGS